MIFDIMEEQGIYKNENNGHTEKDDDKNWRS